MKKSIASVALAATAFSGAVAGAAVVPTLVSAQDDEAPAEAPVEERANWLDEALQELVDDNVITQEQADAVEEKLREAKPERGFHGRRFGDASVLTEALGLEADELRDAIADGNSLAEVAEANGVDPQAVIDALVAESAARIDEAVADGRIDAAQAEELKAGQVDRITDMVNGELPARGLRGRGGFGPRFGPGADDAGADDTTDA